MGGSRITLITFWEHSPSGGCFFVPIPLSTFLSLYPVHVAVGTPIGTFTDDIVSHHPHRSPHPVSTTPIHTGFHHSRPVRPFCIRRACNHFRKYRELVEPFRNGNRCAKAFIALANPYAFGKPATFSKPRGNSWSSQNISKVGSYHFNLCSHRF